MTVTLGTDNATPNPTTTYTRSIRQIGVARRSLAGTMVGRFTALKWAWSLHWSGMSVAQRDAIMAELDTMGHIAWTPYEGTAFTVKVISGKWTPTPNGESCYDVDAELEQI